MAERFSEDPFVLFQLRGRTRTKLLEELANFRRKALTSHSEAVATVNPTQSPLASKLSTELEKITSPHPAVLDPQLWWRYEAGLDSDLEVITPAMEGDTALDAAGDLILAEEPRFPEAKHHFLRHLHAQGQMLGQQTAGHAGRNDDWM